MRLLPYLHMAMIFMNVDEKEKPQRQMPSGLWCERWDSNPHGETTRTSNVLVYHSNTLANDYCIITSKR